MKTKTLRKKFAACVAATAVGVSLTFGTPAPTSAAIFDDVLEIGLSAAAVSAQVDQSIRLYNDTEDGRQSLYQAFRKEYGVNNDPTLNARLSSIMANLTKAVATYDETVYEKPYLYFVSADKSLNAACAMGHVMMVNTGAFDYLSTDDEIAAVVGHEMGHGQRDHVAKGQKKNITKQVVALIGNQVAGDTLITQTVGKVLLDHSVAHGSRKFETEADNLAWDYITRTNYNPGACAAVMQKFVEMGSGNRSALEKVFIPSDHPDSDKRRDNYVKKLYEYSKKHATAKDGVIKVNGKIFTTAAETSKMSSASRAYFVLGNLAAAYHNGHNTSAATVRNGTVYLGEQAIITPIAGDEDAYTLAERLNSIK